MSRHNKGKGPRDKEHHQHFIRPQDVISLLTRHEDGLRLASMERALGIPRRLRPILKGILEALMEENMVERTRGGRYKAIAEAPKASEKLDGLEPYIRGEIRFTPAGNAFVLREDGDINVFIPRGNTGYAMDGDTVLITVWDGHRGPEGRVERVVERGRKKLTGVVKRSGKKWKFIPDDPRVGPQAIISGGTIPKNASGNTVLATIVNYPSEQYHYPVVKVETVIGKPGLPTTEIQKVMFMEEVEEEFREEVLKFAELIPDTVQEWELENREDFIHVPFYTVDPVDARDFDDAVHVERTPEGYRLWVAIADVSHYVHLGDPIDETAFYRGNSIYLPHKAIPMLPQRLSSGICSLKPQVLRLAMVTRMDFDSSGRRISYEIRPGVIKSRARLAYDHVAAVLKGEIPPKLSEVEPFREQILLLHEFTRILKQRRLDAGALDLVLPEAKVVVDHDDPLLVREVKKSSPDEWTRLAYSLIEESMLAANVAVGDFAQKHGLVVPWRVHDQPDVEKLEQFRKIASLSGIDITEEELLRRDAIARAMERIKGHRGAYGLSYLLLRSLKQAAYSVENVGHYALAFDTYVHFTSPIRRYADLMVHRALKRHWFENGEKWGSSDEPEELDPVFVKDASQQASTMERKAVTVERQIVDMYRAWYMRPFIGEEFDATVTSLAPFGIFCTIDDPFVDGLIRLDWLEEDHFIWDPDLGVVRAVKSGRYLLPGTRFRVLVASVDVSQGHISFEVVGSVWDYEAEHDS